MLFEITLSLCNLFLRFPRRILRRTLTRDAVSNDRLLIRKEIRTYEQILLEKHSMLEEVQSSK